MKQQRNIDVYRIEYEILPKMTMFTASIAAESHEAALAHLGRIMGRDIHVTTSGIVCPLHDLTPFVRQMLTGVGAKMENTKPAKVVKVEPELEEDNDLTFKSGRGRKPTKV